MLKDLELDLEEFRLLSETTFNEFDVGKHLNIELVKLKNKVQSRRSKVKEYEILLKNEKLDENLAITYNEFIQKVERFEKHYPRERKMIIRRSICNSLEKIGNVLNKKLLG